VKALFAVATLVCAGCAALQSPRMPQPTPVWVRSHNRSPIDVYLLCGSRDARWLGTVAEKGTEAWEIPVSQPYCGLGLNFFVVVRNSGRGYWVGPFWTSRSGVVDLVIERYAGLSSTRVQNAE